MASESALVQASSRLEKFMVTGKTGILKESITAQVSAAIYYQSQVMASITSNRNFQNKFKTVIFNQINEDFGEYIDAQARVKPKSLHHVYEWNKSGLKSARLFKLNRLDMQGLGFGIVYDFLPSRSFAKGGKRRHVFVNKAAVMEAGMPLKIAPRFSERLVFDVNGYTVYMPKGASVIVSNPGGRGVKNSFESSFKFFFKGNLVNMSIKKSGFQKLFNSSITKAMKLPGYIKTVKYSFSPNGVRSSALASVDYAFGGMV